MTQKYTGFHSESVNRTNDFFYEFSLLLSKTDNGQSSENCY
jgi:hypothetical protein